MKSIIITRNPNSYTPNSEVIIIDLAMLNGTIPAEWSHYSTEFIPYSVCELIIGMKLDKFITCIDFAIIDQEKYLIAHQILTATNAAILFFSENGDESIKTENDQNLFKIDVIKLYSREKINGLIQDVSEAKRFHQLFYDTFDYKIYSKYFQRSLDYDRHQVTNEWAAIKLLFNHGMTLNEIETNFSFPKTVMLKQKFREHAIENSTKINLSGYAKEIELAKEKKQLSTNANAISKVLLIDDNAARGWSLVMKKLFPKATLVIKSNFRDADAIIDFSPFDFIFLDLRLPDNSTSSIASMQNGYKLIEKIKGNEKSLHIPLLVFTASQRATTLFDVQQKGADGMYVKEPLDFDKKQSLDNYLGLLKEINHQLKKGKSLKTYWTAIVKIKHSLLPEISDTGTIKLKSRIIERLEMFYGLLKKSHEQNSFNDSAFHFSSEILSYMTLWSVLNEIQESYYIKGQGTAYTNIKKIGASSSFSTIHLDNWKIKNQSPDSFFIVEKAIIEENVLPSGAISPPKLDKVKREPYSPLAFENVPPYFKIETNGYKRRDYKKNLFLQIAYLILAKDALKLSSKKNQYLGILKKSNTQRNKLYLTHGENLAGAFHQKFERNKSLPNNSIMDLFKLVAYLLTGHDKIV